MFISDKAEIKLKLNELGIGDMYNGKVKYLSLLKNDIRGQYLATLTYNKVGKTRDGSRETIDIWIKGCCDGM